MIYFLFNQFKRLSVAAFFFQLIFRIVLITAFDLDSG